MTYVPQSQIKATTISPPKENQYLPYLNRRLKQNDFVLNCDSSEWKLPEYNSLQDNHLKFFFANPKVRTVLLQTGMIDESGNIHKDTSKINFSRTSKVTARQKLAPLPEGVNMAVQRIVLPYKASRKTKNRLAKASKEQPAPVKRTVSQAPIQPKTQTPPPRTVQSMVARGKPLSSMRKVQPLSKDQLAQVIAKYQSSANKRVTSGTDQSTVASDVTPSKSKQQQGNECESEFKSSGALNSESKERMLSDDEKKPVESPEEPKNEEINLAINEVDNFQLVDSNEEVEEKTEEKPQEEGEEKVEEKVEEQAEENVEEMVEEKAEEEVGDKSPEKVEYNFEEEDE